MHHPQPIIGITFSDRVHADDEGTRRNVAAYRDPLERLGAEVRILAPGGPAPAAGELDGLLLSGGGDVDPSWYGDPRLEQCGEPDAARDTLEIELARQAVSAGVPVFGICRGAQVIGVALGGKLHQDLPTCVPGVGPHSGDAVRHRVRVAPGSRLRQLLGADEVETNSYHHQANTALGEALRAVAESPDGVIEAVEGRGEAFLLGVQWHPERMPDEEAQRHLFAAFVAAAEAYAARR